MANSPSGDPFRMPFWLPGMRIGLLGGSFDPPHEGHRRVSLVALKTLRLDQIWWLVSPHNPLKPDTPSEELIERIRAAEIVADHPRIRVTGIEAELGTSYTADTLRRLLPRLAGAEIVWMMGADNLASFHRWRDWPAIAASVPIAVFNRPEAAFRALASPAAIALARHRIPERAAASLADTSPPTWVFLSRPHIPISSTELRRTRR